MRLGQAGSLDRWRARITTAVAATALLLTGSPAMAGPCTNLARLAQQSAAYYRSSGDQHHYAAARNYQNAYNGCVNAARQRIQAATGHAGSGATSAFDVTMNVLSTLSRLSSDSREQRAHELAVAEEARRQADLVRRQEVELQRQIQVARQAHEEKQRQVREQERERRAELAALKSRCARKNPFGKDSEACAGLHDGSNPFPAHDAPSRNPFARASNAAPNWEAGRNTGNTYDSVNGVDCPEMFERGCVPDAWRQMFSRLTHDHDGDIRAALLAAYDRQQAAQSASFLYRDTLTEDQYRRLGTGDATFADIEKELTAFAIEPVILSSLEEKLAAIESDPQTRRAFQKALDEMIEAKNE